MKYKILEEGFRTKKEINDKSREIIESNLGEVLKGQDLQFIMELVKYHPSYSYKLMGMVNLDVRMFNGNAAVFIVKSNGILEDISITKCISHIPFNKEFKKDFSLNFGKYKGISIYEIDDVPYLRWVYKTTKSRFVKVTIGQYLKYGYIPIKM